MELGWAVTWLELEELSRDESSRNCGDKGDRVGQTGVPGLVWLLAGPQLEASNSVKHPSGGILISCACINFGSVTLWKLTVQARDLWFVPPLERSPGPHSPVLKMPATETTQEAQLFQSHVHTDAHSRTHFK